jgi:hypothetical protein
MLGLPSLLWHSTQLGRRRADFTPNVIVKYLFLLKTEWTQEVLNADIKKRSL